MSDSEVELKLAVDPSDLPRIEGLAELGGGRGTRKRLESVYFDTEDRRLRARDVTLRVRRQGSHYVQTVKAGRERAGGLLSRGEWEIRVAGEGPDLARFGDGPARDHLGLLAAEELKPLFASHIDRDVRIVTGGAGDGTAIEVAIDRGEIRTPEGAVLPVCEIELELKRGERRTLFELALRLAESVPVRLETRSKSDRGYALASGTPPAAAKAAPVEISGGWTVERALEEILRCCIEHLGANEGAALEGAPEGIHQTRVALRRMRSALTLFRPLLPEDQHAWFVGEVRWLAGELGPVRDWDVFLGELLPPVEEAGIGGPKMAGLRAAAEQARNAGCRRARDALLSRRRAVLALRMGAWIEAREWRRQDVSEAAADLFAPIEDFAGALLDKRHRQALRRGRGFRKLDAEGRHELRIALKKLRYACEFFQSLYQPKPVARFWKQLSALQAALGHLNDVATAVRLLDGVAPDGGGMTPEGAGIVVGWHGRGVAELEPRIAARWESFAASEPFWARD